MGIKHLAALVIAILALASTAPASAQNNPTPLPGTPQNPTNAAPDGVTNGAPAPVESAGDPRPRQSGPDAVKKAQPTTNSPGGITNGAPLPPNTKDPRSKSVRDTNSPAGVSNSAKHPKTSGAKSVKRVAPKVKHPHAIKPSLPSN